MRKTKDYFILLLKGIAMGAADVVPGVSGGTIAFISGIYEELIDTINQFNISAIKTLRKEGLAAAWKQVNGNFLVAVIGGILISVLSLAHLITWLLQNEPIAIWSFFFGLVLASIWLVGKQVKKWMTNRWVAFVIGAAIAWWITTLPGTTDPGSLWYIFISGMIAICAMILPGISGSFILVLMGSYATVLGALHDQNILLILVFVCGAALGLLIFAKALRWMFSNYHDVTVALLTGFLLGSLNKLWPWKQVITTFIKNPGTPKEEVVPILEHNVFPATYAHITGNPSQIGLAIFLCIIGIVVILGLEGVANKFAK